MREINYDQILDYVKIMEDMVKRARKAKTITEKIEDLGLVSESCKQLSAEFEMWINENGSEIDEKMQDEAEEIPRKSKKSKFVPKLIKDDSDDGDDGFEMGCSDGNTVIEE